MSRYRLAPYGSLSVDTAHGETPRPLGCDPEVVKTRADAICTGPRSNEVMKYGEEKRREETEERNAQLITFPPVPSSETLLTHFLRFRVSDLNSSLSPLPNSSGIQCAIQYRTCGSYLGVVLGRNHQGGRASAHDLASMGASAAGIVRCHR